METHKLSRFLDYSSPQTATKVVLSCIAILLTVLVLASGAAGAQTTTAPDCSTVGYDGSGTAGDPYKVTNVSQLQCMGNTTETSLSDSFELVSDIDASVTDQWNGGAGFEPVGESGDEFTGTFDGQNNEIKGLSIDRRSQDSVGLFGRIGPPSGEVRDVGVVGADVTGRNDVGVLAGENGNLITGSYSTGGVSTNPNDIYNYAGGLVGTNQGTITESYSTANASSSNYAGGLAGRITNFATVKDSYATGKVSVDNYYAGGLGGKNRGSIERTYATGDVSAGLGSSGGLLGTNDGTVSDSYWDEETTGQSGSAGSATGITTNEMKGDPAKTNMSAFDFTNTWDVRGGSTISYPFLRNNAQTPAPGKAKAPLYAGGDGSASNPYEIANWYHLNNTRQNLGSEFELVSDLNSTTAGYNSVAGTSANGGKGFKPIGGTGESTPAFTGGLNGNGYNIENLQISRTNEYTVGLFRQVNDGHVERISLENVTISGVRRVGGIAGSNRGGRINESYVTGNVTGNAGIGTNTGGIVGINTFNGLINNSYATANVSAPENVGGLVGRNTGSSTIKNSYATGEVSGTSNVGGLVGSSDATETDSYWNLKTTNQSSSDGGTGLTTDEMLGDAATSNIDFDFSTIWDVNSSKTVSYPYLQANTQSPAPGLTSLYAGGSGTESDPYEIATWTQLDDVRQNLDANFTLVNDLNETTAGYGDVANTTANSGKGFDPIGEDGDELTGTFNGSEYTISGLTVDRRSENYVGLFGDIGNAGSVEKVGLEDANLTGSKYVGGIAGWNDGIVARSYAVVNASGDASRVGGIVGEVGSGTVAKTYATGRAEAGNKQVGGVVGTISSGARVEESYAAVEVSGPRGVGGLVGFNYRSGGTVEKSYWDVVASGVSSSDGGTGLTTEQLKANESLAGFDFTTTWEVRSGSEISYPFLQNNTQTPAPGLQSVTLYAGGDGTASNPYQIANWNHLDNVSNELGANYTLVNDLNETTSGYSEVASASANGGKGFDPIGAVASEFAGSFDGAGYSITNLTIDRSGENDVGLFGRSGGTVTNVSVVNAKLTGQQRVGGLVGFTTGGSVNKSHATGTVTGSTDVGGLVGSNSGAVNESYSTAKVSATDTASGVAGGLVGRNSETVESSYATGNVSGSNRVGALVGSSTGTVNMSYATGGVSGSSNVGGLVGDDIGVVNSGYWDVDTTGQTTSAGGTGLTTEQLKANESLGGFDFTTTWDVKTGPAVSYPFLRNNTQTPTPGEVKRPDPATVESAVEAAGEIELVTDEAATVNQSSVQLFLDGTEIHNASDKTFSGPIDGIEFVPPTDNVYNHNIILRQGGSPWDVEPNRNLTVSFDLERTVDGATTVARVTEEVEVTAAVVRESDGNDNPAIAPRIYKGTDIAIRSNYTDTSVFVTDSSRVIIDGVTGVNSRLLTLDTSGLSTGVTYTTEFDNNASNVEFFEIADLGWSVTANKTAINPGKTVSVEVSANRGGAPFTAQLENASGGAIATRQKELDGTGTTNLTFDSGTLAGFNTEDGPYTVTATDNRTTNAATTADIGVSGPPADFSVGITSTTSPVTEDEVLLVTATVENIGSSAGTQTVTLDDIFGEEVDTKSVSLDSGDTKEITLRWATQPGEAGTGDVTVATENDTVSQSVTVEESNHPPTATFDRYTISEGQTLTTSETDVLANDIDPDGDSLSIKTNPVVPPSDGSLTLSPGGSFEYTPRDGFTGVDSFAYEVTDGNGGSDTATVIIEVSRDGSSGGDSGDENGSSSQFKLGILDVDKEIQEGENLTAEVAILNTGSRTEARYVSFLVGSHERGNVTVVVPGRRAETETFVWETEQGDEGEYIVKVSVRDTTVREKVTVSANIGDENGGPLSPDNPFGDSNNEPLDRGEVITKIIDWNRDQNNELDGVSYTRQEIIGFIIEWNRA